MKSLKLHKLCLVALLSLGCEEAMEPGSKVDSLRVLAEQADNPIAHPGETVELSSLSYDPGGRSISWAWASCVNPASSDLQGCLASIAQTGDPESALFGFGPDMAQATLSIPADTLSSLPPGARGSAGVGVVSAACPGDLTLEEGPGGLPFRCTDPDSGRSLELDEFIVGYKRITVRESDRNANPLIGSVSFDGSDWPEDEVKVVSSCKIDKFDYALCADKLKHKLAVQLAPESFERGTDERGEHFEEQLVIQHFSTEGLFESEFRIGQDPKNGWVARRQASGQTITLWFVARDNRGGAAWTQRQVQVQDE